MASSLSAEQKDVLVRLVQAHRSLPRSERQPFMAFQTAMSHDLMVSHQGLGVDQLGIYPEDLRALASYGLLRLRQDQHAYYFDLTEAGFQAYDSMQRGHSAPPAVLEQEIARYLGDPGFRSRHANAYAKWKSATDLLWSTDASAQFTQIGHLCREASQEFASSLAQMRPPPNLPPDPTKTHLRVQAVLQHLPGIGAAELHLLEALHAYWCAAADYIQRQEHGALKEGTRLGWEDARRTVFALMNGMYELDRAVFARRAQ